MTVTSRLHRQKDKERHTDDDEIDFSTSQSFDKRERRWVLLKIPRCDIDGVGEVK